MLVTSLTRLFIGYHLLVHQLRLSLLPKSFVYHGKGKWSEPSAGVHDKLTHQGRRCSRSEASLLGRKGDPTKCESI